MSQRTLLATAVAICLMSCAEEQEVKSSKARIFSVTNLTDEQYPDNPDIGFRANDYQSVYFTDGKIEPGSDQFVLDLSFRSNKNDTIGIENLNVAEFIPTIPAAVKEDNYLSYISCINQEWNRNQVKFNEGEFYSTDKNIVRIDVARNCLNAYLWEVIAYTDENGKQLPYAHGWFDFDHGLYAELFELKNGTDWEQYQQPLENWVDPETKTVDLEKLREPIDTLSIVFEDRSETMYPLSGAREKKYKEIIYPETFSTMKDLQTDSALFATFTPPGFYNRQDPRTTELGRIYHLDKIDVLSTNSLANNSELLEFSLKFHDRDQGRQTALVIGGIDKNEIPVLDETQANKGWKSSMGIGNHSFYEAYESHMNLKARSNPYYAMLLDGEGNWLDSHKIGIDGPIMHYADEGKTELHLWLLSFERHALVGHYVITQQ